MNITKALLQMQDIKKSFFGVEVLHGVDFSVYPGEVHILAGENGAGKSTLMKIMSGVHNEYDYGKVILGGETVTFSGPADAATKGIAIIHQELSVIPQLSVADNIFLGRELKKYGWLDKKSQHQKVKELLKRLGLDLDPNQQVGTLPLALQQMVEIAKALAFDAQIIIMDEPTSALDKPEAEKLFNVIAELKQSGKGIVYISHKMDEIYRLGDRVTVLRDGSFIGSGLCEEIKETQLVNMLVGRELEKQFPQRTFNVDNTLSLQVNGFCIPDPDGLRGNLVDNASFSVRKGEIFGIGGLEGAGNHELFLGLFGNFDAVSGTVKVGEKDYEIDSPTTALKSGLALVTNDRKRNGLVLNMSIAENMTMASLKQFAQYGVLKKKEEASAVSQLSKNLNVKMTTPTQPISDLSGGNQQKVVLGKWILSKPEVLLLDDPTRGVDIGAKREIYDLMNSWTEQGISIVLISSEMPELLAMSDRIAVMHRGSITAQFDKNEATQEMVLQAAMGKSFNKNGEEKS